VICGANHFLFRVESARLKSDLVQVSLPVFGKLGIDSRRQQSLTA
jgi:hypothetical protein